MTSLNGLRDPFGLVLAAAAAITLVALQEGPLVAILAAISVLLVRAAAAPILDRLLPKPPPPPAPIARPSGQPWYHPLTRRESEVAVLVAEGLTNKQIGEQLHSERTVDGHLSERGVDAHVQNIMNKLNMNRRAQLAAWVAERRPNDVVMTLK